MAFYEAIRTRWCVIMAPYRGKAISGCCTRPPRAFVPLDPRYDVPRIRPFLSPLISQLLAPFRPPISSGSNPSYFPEFQDHRAKFVARKCLRTRARETRAVEGREREEERESEFYLSIPPPHRYLSRDRHDDRATPTLRLSRFPP